MGTVGTNFLPANPGQSLGSDNQPWDAVISKLNHYLPVNLSFTADPFSAALAFTSTTNIAVHVVTLVGNVTSSTYAGPPGIVLFLFTQDGIGGRTFVWPGTFRGGVVVGTAANQVTLQMYYYDGVTGWPLTPGSLYP